MTIGDTVVLLSGGPLMTIVGQMAADWICSWFAGGILMSAPFNEKVLKLTKPEK